MKTNPENLRCASFVVTKCIAQRISRGKLELRQRKLVSGLAETRERKRHPENSKCEENKNNVTHVVTQEQNEQTVCQPGPSTRHKLSSLEEEIKRKNTSEKNICKINLVILMQELINIKIQHRQYPKYANTKLREIFERHIQAKTNRKADFEKQKTNMMGR
ncbi:hypothetical protein PR048_017640 [Dryococelus australis]|uniref:Uncharacterized protein n=1 Tax=Dryococelus australis TaxID=614101 RepID=A0ABQ9HA53_9NEOP|nr:hypothetical protein PR048_017640 [Dryococelus australis]